MQNIDKILPCISFSRILKRSPFLFFEIKTCFFVCNPIFGSSIGVQKELGKNLFFLEIIRGAYMPPFLHGISCIRTCMA